MSLTKPFAVRMAPTVTPYRRAMRNKESPCATLYAVAAAPAADATRIRAARSATVRMYLLLLFVLVFQIVVTPFSDKPGLEGGCLPD